MLSKPYHASEQLGPEWKPEIVGRDLSRYGLAVSGKRWIKYGPWLAAPRDPANFRGERLLVQEITGGADRRIVATYYDGELYHSRDVIPVKIESGTEHAYYLLGIVNSKLITWYHHKRNPKAQKGLFPKVLVSDLRKLPIPVADPHSAQSARRHKAAVALVTRMLDLHKRLGATRLPHDKAQLQRQIEATDREIDRLVYELYELTPDEIALVEKETR